MEACRRVPLLAQISFYHHWSELVCFYHYWSEPVSTISGLNQFLPLLVQISFYHYWSQPVSTKILFFLHRDLIKELSLSVQGKQKEKTDILINTFGKALGQIKTYSIFKNQVLLPPARVSGRSAEEDRM